jgi:hypothetical protein
MLLFDLVHFNPDLLFMCIRIGDLGCLFVFQKATKHAHI